MKRLISALALACCLLSPAYAADKDPLAYPLRQYGMVLGVALLGGLVSWYAKVSAGTVRAWNVMQLVGELATSAFAGLLCFWCCESMGVAPLVTASLVGIAGHMGTRAISMFERAAERKFGKTGPAPLDEIK